MKKDEILALLAERDVSYELMEHEAIFNMAECAALCLPHPEAEAKNLFLCDDKKRNFFLVTLKGDKRLDLEAFRTAIGSRRLKFASEATLLELLGLTPGSVTPFGLLNDGEGKVRFYLDSYFLDRLIECHPNDNSATVWLQSRDLIALLEASGHPTAFVTV